ncbi:MAG: hypothetical protein ACTH7U_07560 [Leuconostoc mesenteroides]
MSNANFFFDEQQQVFHLSNQQVSYLIQIEDGGVLRADFTSSVRYFKVQENELK